MAISTIGTNGLTTPLPASNLGTPSAINLSNATALAKAALPTGCILQVVNTVFSSSVATTNTTLTDSGISASITPLSSSNKVLVMISVPLLRQQGGASGSNSGAGIAICNVSGTVLYAPQSDGGGSLDIWSETQGSTVMGAVINKQFLHSPATTSSYTYKIYFNQRNGGTVTLNWSSSTYVSITLLEVAA